MQEKWCWEQGWIAKRKIRATSQYCKTEDHDKRPHDDDAEVPLWPSSQECKPVCSWHTFWKYWADNYSNINSGDNGTCVLIGEDDGAQQEVEDAVDEALKSQQAKQQAAIDHVRKDKK